MSVVNLVTFICTLSKALNDASVLTHKGHITYTDSNHVGPCSQLRFLLVETLLTTFFALKFKVGEHSKHSSRYGSAQCII